MKKELAILLLAFIATVGFAGAVAAQPVDNSRSGSWWLTHSSGHGWFVVWRGSWNQWRHSWRRHRFRGRNYRIIIVRRHGRNVVIVLRRGFRRFR